MKPKRVPYQVGVTGGIGSGKSLVCRIFAALGVPTYDADSRAKKLMTTDRNLVESIKKEFGTLSYYSDGGLNRQYLADSVFQYPDQLQKLNALVHPRVGNDYSQWLAAHCEFDYVIKEAALLFEAGSAHQLNSIISIYASEEIRLKRVLIRDAHRTETAVRQIMANQIKDEEKMKMADFVIRNDDSELVIPQVLRLHQIFTAAKT
jgi:dephospho-CoA kinase